MSKKSRPWSRRMRESIRRRGLLGQWKHFARYFMTSHDSFLGNGGDWKSIARQFDREYQCPACHERPTKCVCLGPMIRMIFVERGLVTVPWESQGERGWMNGEHPEQRANRMRQEWRAFKAAGGTY